MPLVNDALSRNCTYQSGKNIKRVKKQYQLPDEGSYATLILK